MRIRLCACGVLLLLSGPTIIAGQNGKDLYQQGLARETAGDLKSAIDIFERIVRDYLSDRPLTARALVQLGRWFDSLGEDQARDLLHAKRAPRTSSPHGCCRRAAGWSTTSAFLHAYRTEHQSRVVAVWRETGVRVERWRRFKPAVRCGHIGGRPTTS